MELTILDIDSTTVVSISGKIDTNTSPELDKALSQLIGDDKAYLLVDCESLSFISSAGLRVLLSAAKKTKAKSGSLKVCALNPTVKEVFDISGFSTILPVFKDRQQALDS